MSDFSPALDDPPLQVIQLAADRSGWRLLAGCTMLSASNRFAVDEAWPEFFTRWPTPEAAADRDLTAMAKVLRPTGLQHQKAERIADMSLVWLETDARALEWKVKFKRYHVDQLPGCGPYAQESWDVFVRNRPPLWCQDSVIRAWVELCRVERRGYCEFTRLSLPARLRGLPGNLVGSLC